MSNSLNNFHAQLSELYGDMVTIDTLTKHDGIEEQGVINTVETVYDNMVELFEGTKFEPLKQKLLWNLTNAFNSTLNQARREIDNVKCDLNISLKEQDGSDIKDYELQDLNDLADYYQEAESVIEKAFLCAKDSFSQYTDKQWQGYKSQYTIQHQSASTIQAEDFLKNRERSEVLAKAPQGDIVAVIGYQSAEKKQAETVFTNLHQKFKNLIFATRGNKKGLDVITRFFASKNELCCIEKTPDWKRDGKGAGFKRDDVILSLGLKGVVFFEDVLINGLDRQFIKKAKKQGLKIMVKQSPALKELRKKFPTDKALETERQRLTEAYKSKFKK